MPVLKTTKTNTWLILVHTVASNEIGYVLYFISIDLQTYQHLPKGCCLNPTGWCIGTPCHPFSTLWKIQVHIYYTHGILVTHFCGIHIVTNHFVGSPGTGRANDPDVRGNPNVLVGKGEVFLACCWKRLKQCIPGTHLSFVLGVRRVRPSRTRSFIPKLYRGSRTSLVNSFGPQTHGKMKVLGPQHMSPITVKNWRNRGFPWLAQFGGQGLQVAKECSSNAKESGEPVGHHLSWVVGICPTEK